MLYESLILFIENFCQCKAIKLSLVLEKRKGFGNDHHSKRIEVKNE